MPRFLNTYTGEFHWVEDPSKVIYAILSHTWRPDAQGGEQSYTEILEVQRRHAITTNPHFPQDTRAPNYNNPPHVSSPFGLANPHPIFSSDSGLSAKIRGFCQIAREAEYELVWVDSGCIDKSSSAELAEAINSMFELYKHADMCYVYLADVSDGMDARNENSEFCRSRWHFRGWTLQELIAPKNVEFLDKDWRFFGTKHGLAATLQRVTRIDFAILTGKASVDSVSVARRMSWAATRETTRVEDEAYSLLGIFGVHMSPIYGEGRNAFLRLQEEIIKYVPDQTIFVWGSRRLVLKSECFDDIHIEATTPDRNANDDFGDGLLAPSPRPFRGTGDTVALTPRDFKRRLPGFVFPDGKTPSLHCVVTPEGARINFLTIARRYIPKTLADPYSQHLRKGCQLRGSIQLLALLACESQPEGSLIALALLDSSSEPRQTKRFLVTSAQMDHHPLCGFGSTACRFVHISSAALTDAMCHSMTITETVVLRSSTLMPMLADEPTRGRSVVRLWNRPSQHGNSPLTSFRIAPWSEERLRVVGFGISALEVHREPPVDDGPLVLRCSLTTLETSTQLGTHIPFIQIKLTLTPIPHAERNVLAVNDSDTTCCFSVKVYPHNHSSLEGLGADAGTLWTTSLRNYGSSIGGSDGTSTGTFNSERLKVTAHERVVAEAVFLIDDNYDNYDDDNPNRESSTAYMYLQQNLEHSRTRQCRRRTLQVSLQCPREACPDPATRLPESFIPHLLLSVELSDVHISEATADGSDLSPEKGGTLAAYSRSGFKRGAIQSPVRSETSIASVETDSQAGSLDARLRPDPSLVFSEAFFTPSEQSVDPFAKTSLGTPKRFLGNRVIPASTVWSRLKRGFKVTGSNVQAGNSGLSTLVANESSD